MTLNGTLSDLGATQLVQFPHFGRKTGELLVFNEDKEARFYYNQGKLIHASMGLIEGIEVLIDVIGWTDGAFEFRLGVKSDRKSIEQDFHQVLMMALVQKDERAKEKSDMNGQSSSSVIFNRVTKILEQFVSSTPFVVFTCLLDSKASIVSESEVSGDVAKDLNRIQKVLYPFISAYPRELTKLNLVDRKGIITLVCIKGNQYVVVFSNLEASIGVATMKTEKLVSLLESELS